MWNQSMSARCLMCVAVAAGAAVPGVATAEVFENYQVTAGSLTVELQSADILISGSRAAQPDGAIVDLELHDAELNLMVRDGALSHISGSLQTSGTFTFEFISGSDLVGARVGDFEISISGTHLQAISTTEDFHRDIFDATFTAELSGNRLLMQGEARMSMSVADAVGDYELYGAPFGRFSAELELALTNRDETVYPDDASRAPKGGDHDVIVCTLHESGPRKWGVVGDTAAYSIATTSGNFGTANLPWQQFTTLHPVIPQNMYRLKDGRIEQIGMSWLKHGFCALQIPGTCLSGCNCPGCGCLQLLTPGCTDPYNSLRNGGLGGDLGPHWQVNAWTGEFIYPPAGGAGGTLGKRLQVRLDDLDPGLNDGALYFGEAMYVHFEDAQDLNHYNNASYRRFTVSNFGSPSGPDLTWNGNTQVMRPAIDAWRANDSGVSVRQVDVPDEGRFLLYYKASDNGDSTWHYEYALFNVNSDRSGGSFSIPIPPDVTVTNIGFHDVDYHSGDGIGGVDFDGTDWTVSTAGGAITWSTDMQNQNANALRWGSTYNFRFDADTPPEDVQGTLGLFKSGVPDAVDFTTSGPQAPAACVGDIDGNGDVGSDDLAVLLGAWGPNPGHPADLNGDGTVGSADLALLLGNWGPCE